MDTNHICPSCGKPLAPNAPKGLCPECLMKAGFPTGSQAESGGPAQPKPAGFVPPKPEELAPHFPQLEILELLGQGGMGAVYKARQKGLDRLVALKVLPPETAGSTAFAERFTREARAMARLNHPNIVAVYDFGQVSGTGVPPVSGVGQASSLSSSPAAGTIVATATGGTPVPLFYFLMEFVDGVNLRQMLQAHRLSPREAMAIVPQICEALQYAHDHEIVHRDIKPENILLDRAGRVKVADFGLAKLVGTEERPAAGTAATTLATTEAGQVIGTPQYMAPEQVRHPQEVDHRADIYSLGVVFYQMLTGELPGRRIEPPSKTVVIDVRLDEVVLRALEKEPERRYQQASVLKTEVETIVATTSSSPQRSASAPAGETLIIHRAKWLVVPPAIALLTVTILETLLFLGGAAFLGGTAFGKAPEFQGRPLTTFELSVFRGTVVVCVVWALLNMVSMFAAIRLMKLRSYGLGVAVAVLCFVPLSDLIPLRMMVGAWLLIILLLKKIRVAFDLVKAQGENIRVTPPAGVAPSKAAVVARWTARILGTLMFLLFAVFAIAQGTPPIPNQPVSVQIEFVGFFLMALGFLVGWKWEGWAALSILAGAAIFHIVEGRILLSGALEAPSIVGLLYGLCWWMERRPPLRQPPTGTWAQVYRSAGVRLLLLVVVHLALFEALLHESVHWKESTEELWFMFLAAGSLAGLVWAFWPGYRLRGSILGAAAGTITGALLLLALDNFYNWPMRPALGLYQEPNWVAQHPGFQKELQRRIGAGSPVKPNVPRNRQPTVRSESLSDCVVHGIVTDAATGKPIIGARVVNNLFRSQPNRTVQETLTDSDGCFELHTTGYEEHLVTASAPGYESNSCGLVPGTFERNTEVTINIQMRPRKASSTQSSTPLLFGPVIERFLKIDAQCDFLDFDTGNVFDHSAGSEVDLDKTPPLNNFLVWIERHGVDFGFATNNSSGAIEPVTFGMGTLAFGKDFVHDNERPTIGALSGVTNIWNDLGPSSGFIEEFQPMFANEIHAEWFPFGGLTHPTLFETREGTIGMLQIIGTTDNPRGVKIRYKLVQTNGRR